MRYKIPYEVIQYSAVQSQLQSGCIIMKAVGM